MTRKEMSTRTTTATPAQLLRLERALWEGLLDRMERERLEARPSMDDGRRVRPVARAVLHYLHRKSSAPRSAGPRGQLPLLEAP